MYSLRLWSLTALIMTITTMLVTEPCYSDSVETTDQVEIVRDSAIELKPIELVKSRDDAIETAPEIVSVVLVNENEEDSLPLVEAIQKAIENHPGVNALYKQYYALDNLAWQAGRKPNPEIEFEIEDFGGTSETAGFKHVAASLTYTQPIERGDKRDKRVTAASLERELSLWDIYQLEHDLQAEVRIAYGEVQAVKYQLGMLNKSRSLMERIKDTVENQVDAGRSSKLELKRFDLELSRMDLEIELTKKQLEQARLNLASTWGDKQISFGEITEPKLLNQYIPEMDLLLEMIADHPAIGRYDAEYQVLCAAVDLENANAIPDMAVFGGMTRVEEAEETVFRLGVSMDLPIHDQNEGNISAAGHLLDQVEDNRSEAIRNIETELSQLYQLATHASSNFQIYAEDLLPAANDALALTEEGYRFGKFQLLDVLDAQSVVLELENEQAESLIELRSALIGIEALLNIDIELLNQAGSSEPDVDDSLNTGNEE